MNYHKATSDALNKLNSLDDNSEEESSVLDSDREDVSVENNDEMKSRVSASSKVNISKLTK